VSEHWEPYEVTPEEQAAAARDMTVEQMRRYDEIAASLDEYGERWRGIVHAAILAGVSAEEIAERTGASLGDVLAAMGDEEQFKPPRRTEQ